MKNATKRQPNINMPHKSAQLVISMRSVKIVAAATLSLILLSGILLYHHHLYVKNKQEALNASTAKQDQQSIVQPTSSKLFPNADNTTTPSSSNTSSSSSVKQQAKPSGGSSNLTKTPYTPYSCTKTMMRYTTSYQIASYLGIGQVSVSGGNDGYTSTCTPDSNGLKPSDANVQQVNKTIYVGDGGVSLEKPINDGETYDQVYARVTQPDNCGAVLTKTGDNNAYQLCVTTVLHYYGY